MAVVPMAHYYDVAPPAPASQCSAGNALDSRAAAMARLQEEADTYVAGLTDGQRLVLVAELLGENGEGLDDMTTDVSDMSDDEYRKFLMG